jgi:glycerophosphoryl diester phosphodiesterase
MEGQMLVIGHRGASRAHPENTLAAFAGAAELGADWVEFDVRTTLDQTLVIHHDPHLPDGRALIATRAAELPPSVPDLAATLARCEQLGLGVNVEIKSDPREPDFDGSYRVVDAVVDALAAHPDLVAAGRALVTSFDPACVARVRTIAPSVPTGQLSFDLRDGAELVARTAAAGHRSINPWDPFVDEVLVEAAHAAGLAVYPWTVDDPERQRALVELGVDGIITNVPDVLVAVLATSG